MTVREPEPVVALILGDSETSHEIALQIAARGARVVLVGAVERTVAERVGEIAFGGGKARHVVGDPAREETLKEALVKAESTFGPACVALLDSSSQLESREVLARIAPSVRQVVLTGGSDISILLSKVFEAR